MNETAGHPPDPDAPSEAGHHPDAATTRAFYRVLANTAVANVTTSFLWFALTFWIYLETRNVLATGMIGGTFMLLIALSATFFGTLVDKFRKKTVMVASTAIALVFFLVDLVAWFVLSEDVLTDLTRPWFWIFAFVMLLGAIVEQLRNIALSTTVTLLVPEDRRANANGLVGAVQGLAFMVTSVFSGLAVGYWGMGPTILVGTICVGLAFLDLLFVRIPEKKIVAVEDAVSWIDMKTGWRTVVAVPGLLFLIVLTTLNNLIGGIHMALLDPYGLELVSVQMWGILFAIGSTGFIVGGAVIAKVGLGRNPLRTMLLMIIVIGVIGGLFAIRDWAWLLAVGIWLFMAVSPTIEASEQTIIQKVTPYEKQGRVFGFAMTFEAAAAPITSFLIAPIAEFWIIPALEDPDTQDSWAWLLGHGDARGIALVFLGAGIAMILLALGAFATPAYRRLSAQYVNSEEATKELPLS